MEPVQRRTAQRQTLVTSSAYLLWVVPFLSCVTSVLYKLKGQKSSMGPDTPGGLISGNEM
jgi:hypothetical protein